MVQRFSEMIHADRRADRRADRHWLLGLTVAALLLYTLNLGNVALRDWDEATVAQVAHEMATGDALTWLFPTLHDQPYWNKPPLLHWAIALCFRLFGEHEWTARLPGALCGALAVPALYALGRELLPRRLETTIASLVFLTWLPVVRHGRLAMLDGAIILWFIVAITLTLRSRRDLRYSLGLGTAIGLMCLTKGSLGICLGGLLLAFLLWDTPRLLRQWWFWYGLGVGSLPATAWYTAQIQHYGGEFLRVHIGLQAASRLVSRVEGNGGSVGYYAIELLKYGWPWLLFALPGMVWAWQNRQFGWGRLLVVCGGGYGLIISLMQTKLPWYILPLYPILAIAAGVRLADLWQSGHATGVPTPPTQHYPRAWVWGMVSLAIGLFGLLGFDVVNTLSRQPSLLTGHLQMTVLCLALTLGLAAWRVTARDRQFVLVLVWGLYVSLVSFVASDGWLWELNENYAVRPVAAVVRDIVPTDRPLVVVDRYPRPSLAYYAQRPIGAIAPEALPDRWQADETLCVLAPAAVDLEQLKRDSQYPGTIVTSGSGWSVACRTSATIGS